MARHLARFPAHPERAPRSPDEEGKERPEPTTEGRWAGSLSPENCRRVLSACVQATALFGSELWWKGENAHGMVGRLEAAQKLVNQEARSTMGAFRTTNQGALSLESGLKPAATQLDNRLRRFALRLASLPGGDQARELVGASDSALGQRLQSALGC